MSTKQRVRIGENFLRVDAENVAGAFADVGIVDPFVGRDHALVQHDAWQAGQCVEKFVGRNTPCPVVVAGVFVWVELACPGAVGARLSEAMFRGIAVIGKLVFEPSAGSGSTLPIPDKNVAAKT